MTEAAIVLCHTPKAAAARKISRLLEFFGVTSRTATVAELFSTSPEKRLCVLGSTVDFLLLAAELASQPEKQQWWKTHVQSAFCCAENSGELIELAPRLAAGLKVRQQSATEAGQPWKISGKLKDVCGPLAGLTIPPTADSTPTWLCEHNSSAVENAVAGENGAAFLQIDFGGMPIFLSTAEVIDIDAPLTGRVFDIHHNFLAAVPAVLYIKSELGQSCWQPPETTACLVIDDPLLRPRYGFLNYDRLLGLMQRLDFSTNIAFIPWNWNRSSRQTVQLFQENPGRFSLSVHGCDHTRSEYGSQDSERLAWKSRQSLERMAGHDRATGLPHDPVMIFPQGVFSKTAMAVLKTAGFIGTVNSEVISTDPEPLQLTIADFWDVAVMNYSDFPIFTRRYPWAGIANFAFDILLGKPCLINVHHNDFHDDDHCVIDCITQLNGLNARLRWTNLAETVRRSFRQRNLSAGIVEVEMYGNEVRLENPAADKKLFRVIKRESAPETIREIRVEGRPVKWTRAEGRISLEITLAPGEKKLIAISYQPISLDGVRGEGLYYETRVRLRRYLCEVRDNYVMRKAFSE